MHSAPVKGSCSYPIEKHCSATWTGLARPAIRERIVDGSMPAAAVCVLALVGFDRVAAQGRSVTDATTAEVVRRLDKLIRSGDLLVQLEPGCFALGLRLSASSAGSVVERMRVASSMPVELDGTLVALDAVVGVAIAPADPWAPRRGVDAAGARTRRGPAPGGPR
ncbi:MAG: hypothetical protein V9E94_02035 [Microthrixaceae bacterium]